MNIYDFTKKHEGFRAKVYVDPLVIGDNDVALEKYLAGDYSEDFKYRYTIGYGTLCRYCGYPSEISEAKAFSLLKEVLDADHAFFRKKFTSMENKYIDVLTVMAYQLGKGGTLNFKNAIRFMDEDLPKLVVHELRNSNWYNQTPNRVEDIIKTWLTI